MSQIRPDETTYKGWHQGNSDGSAAFFVGWDGVHIGGGSRTQIINGLVDTGQPGLSVTGDALLALITGSTISVTAGEVTAQVAVTTDLGWGTLRPAVPAKTPTPAKSDDLWVSSQTFGTDIVKNTAMPLADLISTLNAEKHLAYSAYGFQAESSSPLAVVSGMTWGGNAFAFGPAIATISDESTVQVKTSDIRPDETTYSGWHEGYSNGSPAFSVKANGLNIANDAENSQIINGLQTPTLNPDLRSLVTSSKLKVASGSVSFQVPLFFGSKPDFTTIRPAVNAGPGITGFGLSDKWLSSYDISATTLTPAIAKGTEVALGDLIDAIEAHASVQLLAFGVLAMRGTPSVVESIDWDGVTYSFVASQTKTTLSGGFSSSFGTDVTYTATVSALSAWSGIPTGEVEFWSDAVKLGTVALVKGSAQFTVKDLAVGATTITAKFLGGDSFLESSAKNTQTMTKTPTTITVPSPDGTLVGANVVLTATVKSAAGVPTGTVEFSVNDGAATSVALVNGKATFTVSNIPVGTTRVFADYLGDPTSGASSTVTDIAVAFPKAVGTPDVKYITRVYRDLFGRNPDAAGLAYWTAKLAAGTPRGAVADGITYSIEYRSGLIRNAYAQFLGRTPDASGLNGWLGAMGRGMTLAQMESGFIASPEYYINSGNTDWAWVGQLYADVLQRPAATSEVKYWVQRLSNGASRQEVSMGFLLSTEHLSAVVNDQYVALLHRSLDPTGQAGWVRILQAGGRDEAIISGIVASEEYYRQA